MRKSTLTHTCIRRMFCCVAADLRCPSVYMAVKSKKKYEGEREKKEDGEGAESRSMVSE
jgi:hypothetical protein